jgi:anti-anti-sigma factor
MYREKVIKIGYDDRGVYIDVNGEGTLRQSNALKQFMFDVLEKFSGIKEVEFYMNLTNCQYVDSTFIGLLLILDKKIRDMIGKPLVILQPSGYVLEVIQQMGLENILHLEQEPKPFPDNMKELEVENINKIELAMMMYLAHSELANLNEDNRKKFESAVSMLKKEIENEGFDVNELKFL